MLRVLRAASNNGISRANLGEPRASIVAAGWCVWESEGWVFVGAPGCEVGVATGVTEIEHRTSEANDTGQRQTLCRLVCDAGGSFDGRLLGGGQRARGVFQRPGGRGRASAGHGGGAGVVVAPPGRPGRRGGGEQRQQPAAVGGCGVGQVGVRCAKRSAGALRGEHA